MDNLKLTVLTGLISAYILSSNSTLAQKQSLGLFDGHGDIGAVLKPGSAQYDSKTHQYELSGSGYNVWFDHDEFHFMWKRMKGDFILYTRAGFIGKGVDPHRKVGWMVRSSLDGNSPHINAVEHGDGLTSLQLRRTAGANTEEIRSKLTHADIIQLERRGNAYTMRVAKFGEPFVTEQVTDLALGDEVYVGLFVGSHNKDVLERGVFRDVRISVPARDNFVPYREYIGSNLEVMDVATGQRTVLYYSPESLQAPNWTPDNRALIYNSNGRIYRFDLKKKTPSVIDTDFATNNNNDHVLSFDGKMLGLSHHVKEEGNKSIVYTVPVKGGKPKRITPVGHSYLHGWSPNGKSLIYTGERNGEFDIYKIGADGGEETQLTTAKGLDDGSEYSPDGQFIYFNSTRSGTMQIWRMKADGTDQQQITNDEYNNWFPHISPDGRQLVILSFSKEVAPNDHPFYKQVYLRVVRIVGSNPSGSAPKVIGYVYGGQGTINTPSWSPDSKQIAFISNSAPLVSASAPGQ